MFLRTLRLRRKDGSEAEYVRLVESYREKGKVKQRIVATLGRKDLLAPHLDRLAELLGRSAPASRRALEPQESTVWGPTLVARHLWKELGMEELLEEKRGKGKGLSLAERAFVLVVNRLLSPGERTRLGPVAGDRLRSRRERRADPAGLEAEWPSSGRPPLPLAVVPDP
ncbi:protein of unknown function [Methylacidimicrobium sp. AP8]|uniref:hypothetical protein n=1 Tax=Methylacidimicrobium sp. AP8 TaxID=2730359 RepID=UPI0018C1666E|nr:protein of unknown function [Methylacidimicrobium sp. AP8]